MDGDRRRAEPNFSPPMLNRQKFKTVDDDLSGAGELKWTEAMLWQLVRWDFEL